MYANFLSDSSFFRARPAVDNDLDFLVIGDDAGVVAYAPANTGSSRFRLGHAAKQFCSPGRTKTVAVAYGPRHLDGSITRGPARTFDALQYDVSLSQIVGFSKCDQSPSTASSMRDWNSTLMDTEMLRNTQTRRIPRYSVAIFMAFAWARRSHCSPTRPPTSLFSSVCPFSRFFNRLSIMLADSAGSFGVEMLVTLLVCRLGIPASTKSGQLGVPYPPGALRRTSPDSSSGKAPTSCTRIFGCE